MTTEMAPAGSRQRPFRICYFTSDYMFLSLLLSYISFMLYGFIPVTVTRFSGSFALFPLFRILHAERNLLPLHVNREHADFHHISDAHHIQWILNKAVCQL